MLRSWDEHVLGSHNDNFKPIEERIISQTSLTHPLLYDESRGVSSPTTSFGENVPSCSHCHRPRRIYQIKHIINAVKTAIACRVNIIQTRRAAGFGLLLLVVSLWSGSSFVLQNIFTRPHDDYAKPIATTLMQTCLNIILLLPLASRAFLSLLDKRNTQCDQEVVLEPSATIDCPGIMFPPSVSSPNQLDPKVSRRLPSVPEFPSLSPTHNFDWKETLRGTGGGSATSTGEITGTTVGASPEYAKFEYMSHANGSSPVVESTGDVHVQASVLEIVAFCKQISLFDVQTIYQKGDHAAPEGIREWKQEAIRDYRHLTDSQETDAIIRDLEQELGEPVNSVRQTLSKLNDTVHKITYENNTTALASLEGNTSALENKNCISPRSRGADNDNDHVLERETLNIATPLRVSEDKPSFNDGSTAIIWKFEGWKEMVFLGAMWLLGQGLNNLALMHLSVPTATTLSSTAAFVVYGLMVVTNLEELRFNNLAAISATCLGVGLLAGSHPAAAAQSAVSDSFLGYAFCLAAEFPYACFAVYLEMRSRKTAPVLAAAVVVEDPLLGECVEIVDGKPHSAVRAGEKSDREAKLGTAPHLEASHNSSGEHDTVTDGHHDYTPQNSTKDSPRIFESPSTSLFCSCSHSYRQLSKPVLLLTSKAQTSANSNRPLSPWCPEQNEFRPKTARSFQVASRASTKNQFLNWALRSNPYVDDTAQCHEATKERIDTKMTYKPSSYQSTPQSSSPCASREFSSPTLLFESEVLLPKTVTEEEVEMSRVFGFVGLFALCTAPVVLGMVHLLGIERFATPPTSTFAYIMITGLLSGVLSNFLWGLTVVLLNPVIATIGLNAQIPLVLLIDTFVFNHHRFTALYLVGSCLIIAGVVVVSTSPSQT